MPNSRRIVRRTFCRRKWLSLDDQVGTMPILAIILTAYLFFFVAVVLIAVAGFLDSRERRPRAIGIARPLAGVTAEQSFNRRYMPLWEEPLSALRMVSESGHSGMAYVRL